MCLGGEFTEDTQHLQHPVIGVIDLVEIAGVRGLFHAGLAEREAEAGDENVVNIILFLIRQINP